jgi:indole-3-glycerol phosphate synthase
VIRPDFKPAAIAASYEDSGAACLSILTDEHFFQGGLKDLESVRARVKIPLLRKDFTLDAYHVYEARAHGADAVLLIVRILEDAQIKDYASLAQDLGMAALVEVHDEKEMERAAKSGGLLIGINNRNLDTLKVDLETTVRLAPLAPKGSLLVGESGISAPDHIRKLRSAGVHAFLIGESLLRAPDPGRKLRELLSS